jgi:hypothetical protein
VVCEFDFVRGIEHAVQRLLDRTAHDPVEMTLDPLIVDPDHVVERPRNRSILGRHGGSLSGSLADLAIPSSWGRQPHSIVRNYLYLGIIPAYFFLQLK